MNVRRNLRYSAAALWRAPWRTLLSVSGMAVGIAAVAVVFALGAGAERAFQQTLEEMGKNLFVVNAGRTETDALRGRSRLADTLRLADAAAVLEVDGVERVAPIVSGTRRVRAAGRDLMSPVNGSTDALLRARNLRLAAGRFIDAEDVDEHRRVAVLGSYIAGEVYRGEWPLGDTVQIGGVPFTVVGILAEKGMTPDGANEDNQVIVPVTTAQRRLFNVDFLERIFVQASSKSALPDAQRRVAELLRRRHGSDDFAVRDQASLLATQRETRGTFTRVVTLLAVLALGLGSVGLLAVLLLAVRERQGEIGLRRAVGARRADVGLQFLVEALLLAALGGVAGLAAGTAAILAGEAMSGWPMALSWRSVVWPFVLSLGVAVAAGALPAWRAAKLDPIAALRS